MLRWEAHNDLALSVGDAVTIIPTVQADTALPTDLNYLPLPDGARFLASHRDNAIYKAQIEIIRLGLSMVNGAPNRMVAHMMKGIFPNLVINEIVTNAVPNSTYTSEKVITLSQTPAVILGIFVRSTTARTGYWPVPMKNAIERNALINSRSVQIPDLFCMQVANTIEIYDFKGEVADDNYVVSYIPLPPHPNTLRNSDPLQIEPRYLSKTLTYAKLFLMIDAQDIENIDRYLPSLLGEERNAYNQHVGNNASQ